MRIGLALHLACCMLPLNYLILHHFCTQVSALEPDWSSLEASLSEHASLHGLVANSEYQTCRDQGTDAYAISDAANGICMHAHDCAYKFCQPNSYEYDLPSYTVDVRSENDIAEVFLFASKYNMRVSVKTTGHSYQGSSTRAGSILVWMHNFPKDGSITTSFQDSCNDGVTHDVIGIGGGETWDDVIEAVKNEYHVVTGGGRTVSAVGGWLQGGGLSFSSRQYGIGVDQVVDFTVVLPNGTITTADRCTNPDLFWALRGGGGGTFGAVTHAHYKLHETTPIVKVEYWLLIGQISESDLEYVIKVSEQWLDFWIEKSPTLDSRWCGGYFNMGGAHLLFAGSLEDARATFLDELEHWYANTLDKSNMKQGVWGSIIFDPVVYESWYEYKGGASAYQNPDATDQTGDAYAEVTKMSARLMPLSYVTEKPAQVKSLLMDDNIISNIGQVNYFLGGNINLIQANETAIHPAIRNSIWSVFTTDEVAGQMVREFIPNDVTGVCYNHHNVLEPDWRNACWGEHYPNLSKLKDYYDPFGLLSCWHCVGYNGTEAESSIEAPYSILTDEPSLAPTILPSLPPTISPSLAPTMLPSLAPTVSPSLAPTMLPSLAPTVPPSLAPTAVPSAVLNLQSQAPTSALTDFPSYEPTYTPTYQPTDTLTHEPSLIPSDLPTLVSSTEPSMSPTTAPLPQTSEDGTVEIASPSSTWRASWKNMPGFISLLILLNAI